MAVLRAGWAEPTGRQQRQHSAPGVHTSPWGNALTTTKLHPQTPRRHSRWVLLTGESQMRLDYKSDAMLAAAVGQRLELGHAEAHPKVGHRHRVAGHLTNQKRRCQEQQSIEAAVRRAATRRL